MSPYIGLLHQADITNYQLTTAMQACEDLNNLEAYFKRFKTYALFS